MDLWSKFQKRPRRQRILEDDLKIALLAGVLSADLGKKHYGRKSSLPHETLVPQQSLESENRTIS